MNLFDIVLLLLIAIAFAAAVRKVIKDRNSGNCCGNCSSCSGKSLCSAKGKADHSNRRLIRHEPNDRSR